MAIWVACEGGVGEVVIGWGGFFYGGTLGQVGRFLFRFFGCVRGGFLCVNALTSGGGAQRG